MSDLYRFDVDYIDEERGSKRIECEDGDYVLAEDALKLQAEVDRYDKRMVKALNILSDEIRTVNAPTYLWNAIHALKGSVDE